MADPTFVTAVGPDGNKYVVPEHYLDNPAFGFKLPPSARVQEPAVDTVTAGTQQVTEPAAADTTDAVEDPAAATTKTTKRPAAGGENKEA